MTQQERLRYLVECLVAEYNEKHNEHIDIPVNEEDHADSNQEHPNFMRAPRN